MIVPFLPFLRLPFPAKGMAAAGGGPSGHTAAINAAEKLPCFVPSFFNASVRRDVDGIRRALEEGADVYRAADEGSA